jgi:hypothetical protein
MHLFSIKGSTIKPNPSFGLGFMSNGTGQLYLAMLGSWQL